MTSYFKDINYLKGVDSFPGMTYPCTVQLPYPYTNYLDFGFVFSGRPVPYVRMTKASMWTTTAQNYLGYQHALANALKATFPKLILPGAPPTSTPALRNKYNKDQKRYVYALYVNVYVNKSHGDWDNYYKTVADVLQNAGIIWNDKMIKSSLGGSVYQDEDERIEFKLLRYVLPEKRKARKRDINNHDNAKSTGS